LLPPLAEALKDARSGDVVGPVAVPAGFFLLLVEEVRPAEPDEATSAHVRQELSAAWLAEQAHAIRLDLSWVPPS
jgi:parvulin-like peptidyl-prolyl isomerase